MALLLGLFMTGAGWAQTTDQNATPPASNAPDQGKTMGRHHGEQGRFDQMAQQLNLTDQQKTQVQGFMQTMQQQTQTIRQDTSLTDQQKQDKLKQLRESTHQQMMGVLNADQQQKFKQMMSEHEGMGHGKGHGMGMGKGMGSGMGSGGPGGMAALNLTPDQKSKLQPIFQSSRQQAQAVRNDASLTPDQKRAKLRDIHRSSMSQFNSILTPEQQQQWQQMRQNHPKRGTAPAAPPSGF